MPSHPTTVSVFIRHEYGNVRIYLSDTCVHACAVRSLTGTLCLSDYQAKQLARIGIAVTSVPDPKAPAFGPYPMGELRKLLPSATLAATLGDVV